MSERLTQYEQLIAKEIAGIISPEEQAILNKAKADDPEVYELWEENYRLFSEFTVQRWMEEKTELPPTANIPVIRKYKRVYMVATCIAVAILGLFLWPLLKNSSSPVNATTVQLRLENGTIIDLNEAGETWVGNILLKKQPGSLKYSSNTVASESALLIVPAGKDYNITLSDGTEVRLNAASSMRFPTSFRSAREVIVTGEAYFKVTKNAHDPFIVKTTKGEVRVLGTTFNVNVYDDEKMEVALVEGKIQYKNGKDSCLLKPGFAVTGTEKGMQIREFNADIELSWLKDNVRFSKITLEELLVMMARSFGQQIVLDNPRIAKDSISGGFNKNRSILFNLDKMKQNVAFTYTIDENKVIHIK